MKKIVITGATSMLGISLINTCMKAQYSVVALVRPGSSRLCRLPATPLLTAIEYPLEQLDSFNDECLRDCDIFFHLAWAGTDREGRVDAPLQAKNIIYTLKAVRLAYKIGCARFVGTGSQAEYGRCDGTISPFEPVQPEFAYGTAKFAAGQLAGNLADTLGMQGVWTRVFSVYGPYDHDDTLIAYCIRSLLEGKSPNLTACEQQWDYLYCADAARALFLLGTARELRQAVYNIGSGFVRPLFEFVGTLRDAIDPSLPLGIGDLPYSQKQVMHLCADISSLTRDTGFLPTTSFSEGIAETIRHMAVET
jgi:nucleoside-diphosphate-sugar epimerase